MNLARASYLGMGLYILSLGLLILLAPGILSAATAAIGALALASIVSKGWKTGLTVLILIMLATFVLAMILVALGSFALLPVSLLQFLAVGCLDHRATGDCATDLLLARMRP
jgi:hypothetical protein